jgi:hypothetical protein
VFLFFETAYHSNFDNRNYQTHPHYPANTPRDNIIIMNKVFGILLVGLLLSVLTSSDVAWAKNWNQNKESVSASNLKCKTLLQKYTSPSINGCVFSMNASGSISFRRNGRTGSIEVCDPNATERDVKELTKNFEGFLKPATLLITNHENGYSGKITLQWADTPIETELPFMEKDFSGTAKAVMDTGISIRLKVKEKAELDLSGDFGTMRLSGPCKKYNASFTPSSNPSSTSKLDKAKATCTELGFTAGTEKHGNCVLKMMDN